MYPPAVSAPDDENLSTPMEIPKKLKTDAVIEALLEAQFNTTLPEEIVLGRLLDREPWTKYNHTRLPIADVPRAVRETQPSMKFQALYEARGPDRVAKVGANVLSYHVLGRYPGWKTFEAELASAINQLFDALKTIEVTRLVLRYINGVNGHHHFISSFDDLTLRIKLRDQTLAGPKNLNYITKGDPDLLCTTRVASKEFVSGTGANNLDLAIDIDVQTPATSRFRTAEAVLNWVDRAHSFEKRCFFTLLPDATIRRLEEVDVE